MPVYFNPATTVTVHNAAMVGIHMVYIRLSHRCLRLKKHRYLYIVPTVVLNML